MHCFLRYFALCLGFAALTEVAARASQCDPFLEQAADGYRFRLAPEGRWAISDFGPIPPTLPLFRARPGLLGFTGTINGQPRTILVSPTTRESDGYDGEASLLKADPRAPLVVVHPQAYRLTVVDPTLEHPTEFSFDPQEVPEFSWAFSSRDRTWLTLVTKSSGLYWVKTTDDSTPRPSQVKGRAIGFAGNQLIVVSEGGEQLLRVDPATDTVQASLAFSHPLPRDVDLQVGAVDPTSQRVILSDPSDGRLWIANFLAKSSQISIVQLPENELQFEFDSEGDFLAVTGLSEAGDYRGVTLFDVLGAPKRVQRYLLAPTAASDLVAAGPRAWVLLATDLEGSLYRLDSTGLAELSRFDLAEQGLKSLDSRATQLFARGPTFVVLTRTDPKASAEGVPDLFLFSFEPAQKKGPLSLLREGQAKEFYEQLHRAAAQGKPTHQPALIVSRDPDGWNGVLQPPHSRTDRFVRASAVFELDSPVRDIIRTGDVLVSITSSLLILERPGLEAAAFQVPSGTTHQWLVAGPRKTFFIFSKGGDDGVIHLQWWDAAEAKAILRTVVKRPILLDPAQRLMPVFEDGVLKAYERDERGYVWVWNSRLNFGSP